MPHSIGHRIQSAAAWLAFRFFQLLPTAVGSVLGAGMAHCYALYGEARGQLWVKRLKRNMSAITGDSDPVRTTRRAYQQIRNSGRVTAEFPSIDANHVAGLLNTIGGHHVDALIQSGLKQPIMIVTAHMANWEIGGASLVLRGIPITSIYMPPRNETVHRLAVESRHRILAPAPGSRLIDVSSDGSKKLLRAARNGENLQIFIDEEKDGLVWCPALGRDLPDTGNRVLAALLALKFNYTILPVHVRRTHGFNFDLIIEQPLEITRTGNTQSDTKKLADDIAKRAESWVRANPEQWYWMPDLNLDRPFPPGSRR